METAAGEGVGAANMASTSSAGMNARISRIVISSYFQGGMAPIGSVGRRSHPANIGRQPAVSPPLTVVTVSRGGSIPPGPQKVAVRSKEAVGVDVDLQPHARGQLDGTEPCPDHALQIDPALRLEQKPPAVPAAQNGERRGRGP